MRHIRITIGRLLVAIVFAGVAFAALREATDLWDSAVFGATLCLLATSVLMVVQRRERRRAFWLGFALFGWLYLGASLVPSIESRLPTRAALAYFDSKVSDRQIPFIGFVVPGGTTTNAGYTVQGLGGTVTVNGPGSLQVWNTATGKPLTVATGTTENFIQIGHSLTALILALVGGALSRRLHDRNDPQEEERP